MFFRQSRLFNKTSCDRVYREVYSFQYICQEIFIEENLESCSFLDQQYAVVKVEDRQIKLFVVFQLTEPVSHTIGCFFELGSI